MAKPNTVVHIPKEVLLKHWQRYAQDVLPFLKGRPVTLEQVFDNKVIWRRYTDKSKQHLIHINSTEDILTWTQRHTYAFHPYICSPRQTAECWYVLDIDPSPTVDFTTTKAITYFAAKWLTEQGLDITLKFCGKNGFHIIAPIGKISQQEAFNLNFEFSTKLAIEITNALVAPQFGDKTNIQKTTISPLHLPNKPFIIDMTSKNEKQTLRKHIAKFLLALEPLYKTSNSEESDVPVIYLDTRIFHRFANIRSPYSIHPQTGLFSMPLSIEELEDFEIDNARVL